MTKWVSVPLLRLKVSPPVIIAQSYCDVLLLRSPWMRVRISDFKRRKLAFTTIRSLTINMHSIAQQSHPWKRVLLFSPHWVMAMPVMEFQVCGCKHFCLKLIIFNFFEMEWWEVLILKIWFWNILGKNLSWKELVGIFFIKITVFIIGTIEQRHGHGLGGRCFGDKVNVVLVDTKSVLCGPVSVTVPRDV